MSALQTLTELVHHDDPYRHAPDNLQALQLEAVRERFAQRRKQIRVLEHRAREAGVDELRSLNDAVGLLFADANYKSYPEAFVDQG
ncbi:MAG TPA: hypothetical protein VGQ23_15580, partial [Burkholderiaceae bacterium]|nr:hypothetical protein [Burkholderiaceae bacterium]